MKIALAQLNPCVGDFPSNTARIVDTIARARDAAGAALVVFPELAICGYSPGDLLFRPELHRRVAHALREIARAAVGIDVVVGHPERDAAALYSSASHLVGGVTRATYRKRHLAPPDIGDEYRYFSPGSAPCAIEVAGYTCGLGIADDFRHPSTLRATGAELIVGLGATPFRRDRRAARQRVLSAAARHVERPILDVNLVGGQGELVFVGGSVAVDATGRVVARAPEFEEALLLVEVARTEGRVSLRGPCADPLASPESVYRALVVGVRDYLAKNRFPGVVVGLSGGIDSALTLAIAVDAIGAEKVTGVLMPSRYTSRMSIDDALAQARAQGCESYVVDIETPFRAFTDVLAPVLSGRRANDSDTTEENIQARCRAIILMAISNRTGRMVLTTGNKSEMAVGYATLYGDMAGGYAPLKDCPKTLVYALARWRNAQQSTPVIPLRVIEREPSAELRPDQKDSDSLPPYEILDPILERYIGHDRTPQQIANEGFDLATAKRVARLVDRSEYKRLQAAPGVRLAPRGFDRSRRFPLAARYDESESVADE